jgi:hypothetical protein
MSSILKTGEIPKSEGKSMTYALLPNFLVLRKGPMRRVCNLVKLSKEKRSGFRRTSTISPILNCLSLRLALVEVVYDLVLRDKRRLTSA